jgi:nitroreductase
MNLLTAIHTRQSVGKVRPDELPRELIAELLAAAAQAPNHHKVYPWRFTVLTGAGRERLGAVMAEALRKRAPETSLESLEAERKRPLRAPVLIAVGIDKPANERVSEIENICAGAAAVQNLLLAAHARGLGAVWRTGPAAVDPLVKAFFGLEPDQHLIAMVYLGYPEGELKPPQRPSFEENTRWIAE